MEFTKDTLDKMINDYVSVYNEHIGRLYPTANEENKEAFLLSNPALIDAFYIINDKNFITMSPQLFLFQGSGKREILELTGEDYADLGQSKSDNKFLSNFIKNKYDLLAKEISNYNEYLSSFDRYTSYEDWKQSNFNIISQRMNYSVKSHGSSFVKHIDNSATYYSQNAYKYVFSDLDFSEIIKAVNDPDFEYALNESLAAYGYSLYLAASSTAGTALENLIFKIIEDKGIEYTENEGTEIGFTTNLLKKNNIIGKKMKQRIMNAASLRNLASHANKGRTIREDARLIYQTIFALASDYFGV